MKWNQYHEDLIKRWSKLSKTYSLMHSLTSQHYSKLDKRLGIPTVILGAITASSIFGTAVDDQYTVYRTYLNGVLTLLLTTLTGVNRFLGIDEKKVKHTTASSKYNKISMDIDTLLSFPRDEREKSPNEFINHIKTLIQNLREDSPDIPTWIISGYINKMDEGLTNTTVRVNKKYKSEDAVLISVDAETAEHHSKEIDEAEDNRMLEMCQRLTVDQESDCE